MNHAPSSNRLSVIPDVILDREHRKYPKTLYPSDQRTIWPELKGVTLVVFASRSGSTALSRVAERDYELSGIGESLNVPAIQTRAKRHKQPSLHHEMARFIDFHAKSGYFMVKSGGPGIVNAERLGFANNYMDIIQPVLLLRKDLVGQALSYVTARISGQYHSNQDVQREIKDEDYDRGSIQKAINSILKSVEMLNKYSQQFPKAQKVILYEDFKSGDPVAIHHLLDDIGIPRRKEAKEKLVMVKKVKRPITNRWKNKFLEQADQNTLDRIKAYKKFCNSFSR